MDSADFVTLMLMDKGYYDYDYKEPEEKPKVEITEKTETEVGAVLARFGFKTKLHPAKSAKPSDEEIQAAGLEFLKSRDRQK